MKCPCLHRPPHTAVQPVCIGTSSWAGSVLGSLPSCLAAFSLQPPRPLLWPTAGAHTPSGRAFGGTHGRDCDWDLLVACQALSDPAGLCPGLLLFPELSDALLLQLHQRSCCLCASSSPSSPFSMSAPPGSLCGRAPSPCLPHCAQVPCSGSAVFTVATPGHLIHAACPVRSRTAPAPSACRLLPQDPELLTSGAVSGGRLCGRAAGTVGVLSKAAWTNEGSRQQRGSWTFVCDTAFRGFMMTAAESRARDRRGSSEKLSSGVLFRAWVCNGCWAIFKQRRYHGLISHLWELSLAFWFSSCVYILCHESGFESLFSFSRMPACRALPLRPLLPRRISDDSLKVYQAVFFLGRGAGRKYMAGSSKVIPVSKEGSEQWFQAFSWFLGWAPGLFRGAGVLVLTSLRAFRFLPV